MTDSQVHHRLDKSSVKGRLWCDGETPHSIGPAFQLIFYRTAMLLAPKGERRTNELVPGFGFSS